jgi:hypothetical protein
MGAQHVAGVVNTTEVFHFLDSSGVTLPRPTASVTANRGNSRRRNVPLRSDLVRGTWALR